MTQISKRIQQEATQWVAKASLGELTADEQAQLQTWLERDSKHRGAYIRAQAVRVTVDRVSALAGGVIPARPTSTIANRLFFEDAAAKMRLAVAATVVLALAATFVVRLYPFDAATYVSGVGELRQVALEDGSSMLLNTSTKAVVRVTDKAREVSLARGEALFEVAKDPVRPFSVRAGAVIIRAIGTAFSVRHVGNDVDVIVTEGVVEVDRNDGSPRQRLTADHKAVVAAASVVRVQELDRRETDRQLAWHTGRLEFDGQSLAEAVQQINQHSLRRVVVDDPDLARRPIVGGFRSIDARGFAQIAAEALDARVVEDGNTIRIEPKPSTPE